MSNAVPIEKLRAWSYGRQGLRRDAADALAALEHVIAVYSSHPTAPLSLLARCHRLDSTSFASLEESKQVVRIPAMRGSVFMVPANTAPAILAATRMPLKKLQGRLNYGEISLDEYERIKQEFLKVVITPKTTDELQDLIPSVGKLMVAIRALAYEGIALRVGTSLRSDSFCYVSAPAWLGEELPESDPDVSLSWLASEYLRAFGPVTPGDFAWWAGVTKTRARQAFKTLQAVELGDGLLIHVDDHDGFARCSPLDGDEIAILPKWDAYTMGYPAESRARFVDDADHPKAYPQVSATRGDGAPLVLRAGKAVASWRHRFDGDRMTVTLDPFDDGDSLDWLSEEVFDPAASVLGATDLSLTRGDG